MKVRGRCRGGGGLDAMRGMNSLPMIYVLGGGTSVEREVSLRSATAVSQALQQAGVEHEYVLIDDDHSMLDEIATDAIVFPILLGAGGEDGVIQQELENRQLRYLGSRPEASRNCFDKWKARLILEANGLPIAEGELVTQEGYDSCALAREPHVLKITKGGSSIGTYVVRDARKLDKAKVQSVFEWGEEVFVERLIKGTEITVGVLDGEALPVVEIIPPENGEFDYENKYNGKTRELCPPESLDAETIERAQRLAVEVNRVMGVRHLCRIDMMAEPSGDIKVLEVNTMPGMTQQSLLPKAALAAGLSMPELVLRFVELVLEEQVEQIRV